MLSALAPCKPHSGALLISSLLCVFSSGAGSLAADDSRARDLVRRIETQYQGQTAEGRGRMRIVTESWQRELVMDMWSEGRDKFFTRIVEPQKEAGVSTLKVGDDIWNYLPRIDRLMKIPSGLMGEGWMGSHLTNDDLVKENKIDELYDFSFAYEDAVTATILAIPKPDAAVVWGKILYSAEKARLLPLQVTYYDEDGIATRTMTFSDPRQIAGRWVAMKMSVQPVDKPKESTVMIYERLQFDTKLPAGTFDLVNLKRR